MTKLETKIPLILLREILEQAIVEDVRTIIQRQTGHIYIPDLRPGVVKL